MSEKNILVQGGTVYCGQSVANNSPATAVPLTVTSQTLVEANGNKLVATEKDETIANMNFGLCNDPKHKVPPPCQAKVKWSKAHEGILIGGQGLKLLTEESEAVCNVCSVPGKIKVAFHGQQAEVVEQNMKETNQHLMQDINPLSKPFVNKAEDCQIKIVSHKDTVITVTLAQIKASDIR